MTKVKILLADGDYCYTNELEPFLEERGYEVDVAKTAGDALRLIRKERQMGNGYCAVLTKLFIPKGQDKEISKREKEELENAYLAGLDLIDAVRRKNSILPIIAITNDDREERYAFRHRATKVVKKNSDFEDIETAIRECLPQASSAIR